MRYYRMKIRKQKIALYCIDGMPTHLIYNNEDIFAIDDMYNNETTWREHVNTMNSYNPVEISEDRYRHDLNLLFE